MSKLLGGLFSRPSGKASGLVFGSGRTKRGKQVTAREYVIPTDPKTNAQKDQRGKMPYVTKIIQGIGREVYQFDWNRAVNNLPGFQSLSSVFMSNISKTGSLDFSTLDPVSLGIRHFPDTFGAEAGTGEVTVTWSTETGDIGSSDDIAVVVAIQTIADSESVERQVVADQSATRDDGTITISVDNDSEGDQIVLLYFKSDTPGSPSNQRLSEARWAENLLP